MSGAAPLEKRPGLTGAIDAAGEHRAGVLVVAKRDRLARDPVIAAIAERLAQRQGASIVSADGTGNGEGPEAQLMRGLVDLFAAYERALISTRTKNAMAVKRARGERTSKDNPFGYTNEGPRLVPHAGEQAVLLRIRELRAGGLGIRSIARTLNCEGVPARGRKWYPMTVQRVLAR